jgi:hypothetical protein
MTAYGEPLVHAALPDGRSVVDKIFSGSDVCLAGREPASNDGHVRKSLHELATDQGKPPRRLPIRSHFLRERTCNSHQRKRQKQEIAVILADVDANAIGREVPRIKVESVPKVDMQAVISTDITIDRNSLEISGILTCSNAVQGLTEFADRPKWLQ